jgi:hypothetical protein
MQTILIMLVDILAVSVMVLGVYFRRHRRRDMLLAYLSLNIGVMAVTLVLASAPVAAGLGLGLFGVLSIIRLRSSQLTQEEVAYYFASLALGLVAGLRPDPLWVVPLVSVLIVLVMYVADHPRLHALSRQQIITLDAAISDEAEVRDRLEALLGGRVQRLVVSETDLVRDVTVVDVRYRLHDPSPASSSHDLVPTGRPAESPSVLGDRTSPVASRAATAVSTS